MVELINCIIAYCLDVCRYRPPGDLYRRLVALFMTENKDEQNQAADIKELLTSIDRRLAALESSINN